MTPSESGERRSDLKSTLLEHLRNPVKLRICVMLVVSLVGYGAVYMPLSQQITETTHKLNRDRHLLEVAKNLEQLETQYHSFQDRIPQQTDTKAWVQYLMEGTRQFPLEVLKLDSREPKGIGPYKAVVLLVVLEGPFCEMDKFLEWLETNQRILRIDKIDILQAAGGSDLNIVTMKLTVLGMTS